MMPRLPNILFALAVPALLAACSPSWTGSAPVSQGAASGGLCGAGVTTKAGETVYSVARRCGVSVRELIDTNGLTAPFTLNPGTFLRMPGQGNEHVVQKGDTLLGIARKYKVDFNSLAATNGKSAPYTVRLGEKLRIPDPGSQTAVAAAPAPAQSSSGPLVVASPNAGTAASPPPQRPVTRPIQPAESSPPQPQATPQQTAAASHPAFQPTQTLPQTPPARAASGFLWPLKGEVVAEFGPLAKGQHNDGINIAAPKGTPVHASDNGVVAYAGNELKGFGNLLLIKHADGWMTAYAHNDTLMVKKGDKVTRGQTISTVGQTGGVTSPQLHFEIRKGTEAMDPSEFLKDGASS